MKRRQATKQNLQSLFFIVLVLVICILLNLFIQLLSSTMTLGFDMSSEKTLKISAASKNYVNTLREDINIYVASPKKDISKLVAQFLDRYSKLSRKIHLNYVDLDLNPGFAQKYGKNGQMDAGSIVVESSKRFTVISSDNLYVIDPKTGTIVGFKAEQKITSAVIFCLNGNVNTVSFIQGHDEETLSEFRQLLYDNNLQPENVNLMMSTIPNTSKVAVIAGSMVDFSAEEINRLWEFVNQGGSLMILSNPTAPKLERLTAFLSDWGLRANSNVTIDQTNFLNGSPVYVTGVFENIEFNQDFSVKSRVIVVPFASTVELLYSSRDSRKTEAYISSSSDSYAKDVSAQGVLDYSVGDKKGPFPLIAVSKQTVYKNNQEIVSSVMLSGSVYFLSDECIQLSGVLNGEYGLQMTNYLMGMQDSIKIMPRYFDVGILKLSVNSTKILGVFFSYGLPVIIAVVGIIRLWRRRRV
jgi:ABC-2 type transport system permease protein